MLLPRQGARLAPRPTEFPPAGPGFGSPGWCSQSCWQTGCPTKANTSAVWPPPAPRPGRPGSFQGLLAERRDELVGGAPRRGWQCAEDASICPACGCISQAAFRLSCGHRRKPRSQEGWCVSNTASEHLQGQRPGSSLGGDGLQVPRWSTHLRRRACVKRNTGISSFNAFLLLFLFCSWADL